MSETRIGYVHEVILGYVMVGRSMLEDTKVSRAASAWVVQQTNPRFKSARTMRTDLSQYDPDNPAFSVSELADAALESVMGDLYHVRSNVHGDTAPQFPLPAFPAIQWLEDDARPPLAVLLALRGQLAELASTAAPSVRMGRLVGDVQLLAHVVVEAR